MTGGALEGEGSRSGAGSSPEQAQLADEATLITYSWPERHEALAELLRRSEVVYCFESTAITTEAALCGCPAVTLPSPFFDGVALSEAEIGRHGIPLNDSPDEIAFARRTVGQMWDAYQASEARFWSQLDHFVASSQAMPVSDVAAHPAEAPAPPEARQLSTLWRKRQTVQEIHAQLLAERMVLQWSSRAGIHFLMAGDPGEESLLPDTLDSQGTIPVAPCVAKVSRCGTAPHAAHGVSPGRNRR